MGRATGIVSTARITHATPAAAFAHSAQRDWEADSDLSAAAKSEGCIDIARPLVEGQVGSRLDLVLGGGRANFLPATAHDPEYPAVPGKRADGPYLNADRKKSHPSGSLISDERPVRKKSLSPFISR